MYYSFGCQVQSMEPELYEVALDYLIFFLSQCNGKIFAFFLKNEMKLITLITLLRVLRPNRQYKDSTAKMAQVQYS